jgi:hypothetical protein
MSSTEVECEGRLEKLPPPSCRSFLAIRMSNLCSKFDVILEIEVIAGLRSVPSRLTHVRACLACELIIFSGCIRPLSVRSTLRRFRRHRGLEQKRGEKMFEVSVFEE